MEVATMEFKTKEEHNAYYIAEAVKDVKLHALIIDQMECVYDEIYDTQAAGDAWPYYKESVEAGDLFLRSAAAKPLLTALVCARGDMFISDREVAALAIALYINDKLHLFDIFIFPEEKESGFCEYKEV
jgi:hypothetical protein